MRAAFYRRVPAAVDDDAPAQLGRLPILHVMQQTHRVEHSSAVAGRQVGAAPQLGPDRQHDGVYPRLVAQRCDVLDRRSALEVDARRQDSVDLGVQHLARQPVARDAVPQHPARHRLGLPKRDPVAEAPEVVRRRQAARAGPDHDDMPTGVRRRPAELPAVSDREVAEEALHRVDPDRLVDLHAVARRLARVVADPAHDGGQRVQRGQVPPGALVVPVLRVVQPAPDVLARRARLLARRSQIRPHRPLGTPGTGAVGQAGPGLQGDGERLPGHVGSSSGRSSW